MKLVELDAQLVRWGVGGSLLYVEALADAHGILFDCPVCKSPRTHSVLVWFRDRGVPAEAEPRPRWAVSGTGLADLTLSPSIDIRGTPPCWHGWVQNGEVRHAQ